MFEVDLSPSASEFYAAADRPLALKLVRCFHLLEENPRRGNNIRRLKGEWKDYLRFRVGDWRVICRIEDAASRVKVVVIAHRRESTSSCTACPTEAGHSGPTSRSLAPVRARGPVDRCKAWAVGAGDVTSVRATDPTVARRFAGRA
jgi:mRNA interferase RelE/StbE